MGELRVGIDLVEIAGLADSIARFGDAFLHKVFTANELTDCAGATARLAARFAAKEAAMKVLRPRRQDALPWRSIEVRRDGEATELVLHDQAQGLADRASLSGLALSITHERDFAAAVVVAQTQPAPHRGEAR